MTRQVGHRIALTAARLAISIIAVGSAPQAASLITVPDTRVFPESISVTSTSTTIKDGFGQLTAIAVVGNIAWVAESKFALRNDPNNKDPGPWNITAVTLP